MRDFFIYLLKSGLCLAVFLLIYRFLLRKETFFRLNRFCLLVSMAAALIIPLNTCSPSVFPRFLGRLLLIIGIWRTSVTDAGSLSISDFAGTSAVSSGLNPFEILTLIYFIGVFVLSFRFIINLIRVIHTVRRYGSTRRDGLRIVLSDHVKSPFSFLNLLFMNPADSDKIDFKKIITHERVHIRQWHTLDLFFSEILIIFQWMNPFVWPYKRYLQETHEFLADAGVIAQGFDAADYQLLIVEQNMGGKLLGLSSSFRHTQIKRRIHMILQHPSKKKNRFKILIFIPVFLFLMFLSAGLSHLNSASAMHTVMQKTLEPFHDSEAGGLTALQEKELKPGHEIQQTETNQKPDSLKALKETEMKREQAEREREHRDQERMELERKRSELERDREHREQEKFELENEKTELDQEKNDMEALSKGSEQKIKMLETDLKEIQLKVSDLNKKREFLIQKSEDMKQVGDSTSVKVQEKVKLVEEEIDRLKVKAEALRKKLQEIQS